MNDCGLECVPESKSPSALHEGLHGPLVTECGTPPEFHVQTTVSPWLIVGVLGLKSLLTTEMFTVAARPASEPARSTMAAPATRARVEVMLRLLEGPWERTITERGPRVPRDRALDSDAHPALRAG